jgi:acetylornithine deacetylase
VSLSARERQIADEIARRRSELVQLASELVGFDTTARGDPEDPPREETALQEHLAGRLRDAGAEVDLWEPSKEEMAGRPLVPPGLGFEGRPQLVGRFKGTGGGKSLLFNGHIDAVSVEPIDRWTSNPFEAEVRDGLLYGRGSCDMKGGIAAMTLAAEVIAEAGVELAGDLLVTTNTDEESSGAGSSAIVARGIEADAGIVTEATGFHVWVACRGSEYGVVSVPGRPGHAEVFQRPWRDGGAVNAIEKAAVVIEAMQNLRSEWSNRAGLEHPYLSKPDVLPTMASAGDWPVTYPASCDLTCVVLYLPSQADEHGFGGNVRREVEEWVLRETARDDWLAENPPSFDWWPNGVMPLEIPDDAPIVSAMLEAGRDVDQPGKLFGLDSWYDGATFTHLAGIPSIAYGPRGFPTELGGPSIAHTIDEHVPVDDLVQCAQALAVCAVRFCGKA